MIEFESATLNNIFSFSLWSSLSLSLPCFSRCCFNDPIISIGGFLVINLPFPTLEVSCDILYYSWLMTVSSKWSERTSQKAQKLLSTDKKSSFILIVAPLSLTCLLSPAALEISALSLLLRNVVKICLMLCFIIFLVFDICWAFQLYGLRIFFNQIWMFFRHFCKFFLHPQASSSKAFDYTKFSSWMSLRAEIICSCFSVFILSGFHFGYVTCYLSTNIFTFHKRAWR